MNPYQIEMGNEAKLVGCFDQLNVSVDTLENRKIFQKTLYFMQQFGIDLGYDYGFYIYGPYSTELTSDVFNFLHQRKVAPKTIIQEEFSEEEGEKFIEFQKFISNIDKKNLAHELELLSSIHFLNSKIHHKITDIEEMIIELHKRKPDRFSNEEIRRAWEKLMDLDLIK